MTQVKFGRNYRLSVQLPNGKYLQFGLPFTLEFTLMRSTLGSINSCEIRLYNLSEKNRADLRYDWSNYSGKRIVQLNAGYQDNLPLVFYGTIQQGWSYREGVDFVTTLYCQDGAYAAANSIIPGTASFPAGTTMETIFKTLMSYVKNTSFGEIGNSFIYDNGTLRKIDRAKSFTGDAIKNLIELTGKAFYIDNGKTYILKNEEYIRVKGRPPIINAASGLLNTPLLEVQIVTFDMIFEPSLFIGQLIQLQSETIPAINNATINNQVNNHYKITSLKHKCTISPAVCGDAITTVEFYPVNSPI